jgi:hypothetical protein
VPHLTTKTNIPEGCGAALPPHGPQWTTCLQLRHKSLLHKNARLVGLHSHPQHLADQPKAMCAIVFYFASSQYASYHVMRAKENINHSLQIQIQIVI